MPITPGKAGQASGQEEGQATADHRELQPVTVGYMQSRSVTNSHNRPHTVTNGYLLQSQLVTDSRNKLRTQSQSVKQPRLVLLSLITVGY